MGETELAKLKLFQEPVYMELVKAMFTQLRTRFLETDVEIIHEIGFLYLNILSAAVLSRFKNSLENQGNL